MASTCINSLQKPPENFLHHHPPPHPPPNWFFPQIADNLDPKNTEINQPNPDSSTLDPSEKPDIDFEFRLDNPVSKMLPADMLFSGGKLVPLQKIPFCSQPKPQIAKSHDPPPFSPKTPKCGTRWKEILGLKKVLSPKPPNHNSKSNLYSSVTENAKSLKHFLYKNSKSSDSSMSVPLLRDSDSELSISSRLSLSSSSSGDDFPRLSIDSDKPGNPTPTSNRPRLKFAKVKTSPLEGNVALAADSPRLNASGKVIFERSSSSPSSLNGRQRCRPKGMERSYSANVRVAPVLNVPVCSLRGSAISVSVFGIGQLFSAQKKEKKGFNGVRYGA